MFHECELLLRSQIESVKANAQLFYEDIHECNWINKTEKCYRRKHFHIELNYNAFNKSLMLAQLLLPQLHVFTLLYFHEYIPDIYIFNPISTGLRKLR